jgi:uncharacterized protein YutE (UPF0331/DUF86 family)
VVDRDLVLAKLGSIDRCLQRIAEARARQPSLFPLDTEDIVLLNLQRAVQACMDLATHVVATEGYGLPDSVAAAFTLLERQGIIEPPLAQRLQRMVGFRNIAVHNYRELDPAVVEAILTRHLGDLTDFGQRVVRHFGL